MRHRVYGKHLGRDKNQRMALFRSLVRNLLLNRSIKTTEAKAKAIKGLVDKLFTKAKHDSLSSSSALLAFLGEEKLVKLIQEIAGEAKSRTSGFTTLVKLGTRAGDGAMMVKMSLVTLETEGKDEH